MKTIYTYHLKKIEGFNNNMGMSEHLIAYVHIEKAAGQSVTAVLESNFTFRHCRVKPLKKSHSGVFRASDLKAVSSINPYLQAISGHSVIPTSNLYTLVPQIRYITLLREPVARYISHYQYWTEELGKKMDFSNFLDIPEMQNFQTKKIAGKEDISKAVKILEDHFFLVGTVDDFIPFMKVLSYKLKPISFDKIYIERKNVADKLSKENLLKKTEMYLSQIRKNNQLDLELYDFVKNKLFYETKIKYEHIISTRERKFRSQETYQLPLWKIYRNLFYSPIIRFLRKQDGLPPDGSY
jgi:hypothetical protein